MDGSSPPSSTVSDLANRAAEQAVLGCMMRDGFVADLLGELEDHHFAEGLHQRLFEAMAAQAYAGKSVDPILIMERFRRDPAFEEVGAIAYLADLLDHSPPPVYVGEYALAVIDMAVRREIARIGQEAQLRAQDGEATGRQHLEQLEAQLFDLAESKQKVGGFSPFSVALAGALANAAAAKDRDGQMAGLSTGLAALDQKLGGLHPSDLLILAGRPSMGKTALATNIAYYLANAYSFAEQADGTRRTINGGVVAFFSLEMSKEQLAGRIVADVTNIRSDLIRRGDINDLEYRQMRDAEERIASIPLFIDDTGGLSIAKLCARARRLKRRHGLDLVVVDYLQLVVGTNASKGGGRVQEVSEVTAALKALAKELGVPVLALSQLSRNVESRDDKRPQLSDLRESGSIEQDADAVMFVYREEYYLARSEPKEGTPKHHDWSAEMDQVRGIAEVIIGKQRHGPIGTVKLSFSEDTVRFGNLARGYQSAARLPYDGDA
jgi:replicative DNA helicase